MKVSISSPAVMFTLVMLLWMPCNYVSVAKVDGTPDDQDIEEMDRQSEKLNDMLSELDGLADVLRGPLQQLQDAKMRYTNSVHAGESPDKLTEEQIKELEDFNGFAKHTSESRENDHAPQKRKNEDSSATNESADSSEKTDNEGAGSLEKSENEGAGSPEKSENEGAGSPEKSENEGTGSPEKSENEGAGSLEKSANEGAGSPEKSENEGAGSSEKSENEGEGSSEKDESSEASGRSENEDSSATDESDESSANWKAGSRKSNGQQPPYHMSDAMMKGLDALGEAVNGAGDTLRGSRKDMPHSKMDFFQAGESPHRLTDEQIKVLENLDFTDLDDDLSEKTENEDSSEKSENEDSSAKGKSDDASVNRQGESGKSNGQQPPYHMSDDMIKELDALGSLKDPPRPGMAGMNFFQVGEGLDRLTEKQVDELRNLPEQLATEMEDLDEAVPTEEQFAGSDNSGPNEDSDGNEKVAQTVSDVESKKERSTQTCNAVADGVCLDDSGLPIPNILRKEWESDAVPNILRKKGESDPIPNILKKEGESDRIPNELRKEGENDPVPNILRKAGEKDSIPNILREGGKDDAEAEAYVEINTGEPTKYAETKPHKYTKENNNGKAERERKKNAFHDWGMSGEEAEEFEAFVKSYHPGKEDEEVVSEEEIEKMNIALKDFL